MGPDAIDPGPIDASVLYDQDNHVSSAVWDGQERGVLRCHEHTLKLGEWRLTSKQIELVEKAGFGYLRRLPSISLDNPLISALIERWRKETNTFHMAVGEMTITLKDVALLLGLAIDGEPVLGITYTSCKSVCEKFLGRMPEAGYMSGGMVKLSWLKEYFSHISEEAPLEEVEHHTRAYLLYLVGSTIFSTTTGNKVPVMYLPLFEDFEKAGKYAWGAAALAFLYRSLGNASLKSQSTISGCLTLLQCWSYFYLNIGRPKFYQEPVRDCFPLVFWWKGKQSAATVKRDIFFYRKALDSLKSCDVEWLPFKNMDSTLIPDNISSSLILGRSKTMLICFDKAERQLPDRCLRQHGMCQGIPERVQQWERKTRGVDSGKHLSGKMESELNEWLARRLHILQDVDGVEESEYMHWYLTITRKFVGRLSSSLSQIQRTVKFRIKKKRINAGLRDIANIADTFSNIGLDPLQIESISRIRAIAHACLGDQVDDAIILSSASQIEPGKRREKERVRKNTNGKRKRKGDSFQCLAAAEDDQSLCVAVDGVDQMQLCHAIIEVDHLHKVIDHPLTKLGKRARKMERSRRRTNRKRRRKEYLVQLDAARKNLQFNAVVKDDQDDQHMQLCIVDDEVEFSQPYAIAECEKVHSHCTAGEDEIAESSQTLVEDKTTATYCGADEGENAESSQAVVEDEKAATCWAPSEGENVESSQAVVEDKKAPTCCAAGEGENVESSQAVVEDKAAATCAAAEGENAESCLVAAEGEKAESCLATAEAENAEPPPVAGEDREVVSSCEAGAVRKVVSSPTAEKVDDSKKLADVTDEVRDLNQSLIAGENVEETALVVVGVITESSCEPDEDVPQQIEDKKAEIEVKNAVSCHAIDEGENVESSLATGEGKKAVTSPVANKVDESTKLTDVTHKVGDLNQSVVAGKNVIQTAMLVEEMVPESAREPGEDVPQQTDDKTAAIEDEKAVSCHEAGKGEKAVSSHSASEHRDTVSISKATEVNKAASSLDTEKIDETKHIDVTRKVRDLNESFVAGESVMQTPKVAEGVVAQPSHEPGEDVPKQTDDEKVAVEDKQAESSLSTGEDREAVSLCETIEVNKVASSLDAEKIDESKLLIVTHKVGDLNESFVAGESDMQTKEVAKVVVPMSSPRQIYCNVAMPTEGGDAKKVDESLHTDVIHNVDDLNQSVVVDESVTQTAKVFEEVVPDSTSKTDEDVP